jgi:chemotaxis protein CheZ
MKSKSLTPEQMDDLVEQIEAVWRHFQDMQSEAQNILSGSGMPDACMHLEDVLKTTEDATFRIIGHVNAMSEAVSDGGVPENVRQAVLANIGGVFEACSFQDITGQRIKKVLSHISSIGEQLERMSSLSRAEKGSFPSVKKDALLNGPQLLKDMPTQSEVDGWFEKNS